MKCFVKQMGLEEWSGSRSHFVRCALCRTSLHFSLISFLPPYQAGYCLYTLPPGKLTFLNSWHPGDVFCPLFRCHFWLAQGVPKRKKPFSWALSLVQVVFWFLGYRRNSYNKTVQKMTVISHIKRFFATANAWLLGRMPKLIDIICLKPWQPVSLFS